MVALIKAAIPSYKTAVDVFADLGRQLAAYPPPEEQRLSVLNEVWKYVRSVVKDKDDEVKVLSYIKCNAAWMDLVQRHCSEREVMVLLSDLTAKLSAIQGDLSDDVLSCLEGLVASLISKTGAFGATVLTSDHLLKIMDMFKGPRKVSLCMDVLDLFRRTQTRTGDAVLINTMIDIGRSLHDSLDMLSADGDRRHISRLINGFIGKIDFGRDLEQQLTTFVECRGIFSNLDQVKEKLVMCVIELAHRAYAFMNGKHSKKTGAFAKACLAYCHITIPSIASVSRKLQLLVHCAECALVNQCLPQTDTFLKAAISLIPDMPASEDIDGKRYNTEEHLSSYLRSLLALLVLVPGHPDHGPFYIVQGLLNAIPKFAWQSNTDHQTRVYVDMLALLATYAQKKFPYSIPHVESNDVLYCKAPGYSFDLAQHTTRCVEAVVKQLTAMGEVAKADNAAKMCQARLTMNLINQLASRMELNTSVGEFLVKLVDLAALHKNIFTSVETAYWKNTLKFVQKQAAASPDYKNLPLRLREWQ